MPVPFSTGSFESSCVDLSLLRIDEIDQSLICAGRAQVAEFLSGVFCQLLQVGDDLGMTVSDVMLFA